MSDSFMIQALFIGVDQRIYLISLRNAKHMSKLYSADIHMQLTKSEIKHIYTKKVNFCMHTHFYALVQSITSHQLCSFSVSSLHIYNTTFEVWIELMPPVDISPSAPLSVCVLCLSLPYNCC